MTDYSQNGEQRIILDYFGDRRGTFLDIGANDGVTLSNTRALAMLGWNGVMVEPSETAYGRLVMNNVAVTTDVPKEFSGTPQELMKQMGDSLRFDPNPRIHCINAAITTTDGPVDFWDCGVHLHKGDTSLLSTTRPEELARWKRSGEHFTKTTVRGITFKTLLKECGYGAHIDDHNEEAQPVPHFDFITIDVEGADFDVLRQIDLTAVGCKMLCVEVNGKDDSRFRGYCASHAMRLVWQNFENRIFAV